MKNMKKHKSGTGKRLEQAYAIAREVFAEQGVDTELAIRMALSVPISLHCWQADDVGGFEVREGASSGGGILATGTYPGRARNGDEVRADLDEAMRLLPGVQRVNVHACYAETNGKAIDRDELELAHFYRWIDWAKAKKIGLDFNPTYFAHPNAADGLTLSHPSKKIREFWIRHGVASRRIAECIARRLGSPCVNNHWVPDGMKDSPADRWSPRARLADSYDRIFDERHGIKRNLCVDAVESKLFGLGSEDYVVGSMEFYTGYALSRGVVQCLDMGHFHPTEGIHDKISALLQFQKKLLIHTSRPIRWDSDHVVIFNDDVRQVFQEIVRGDALDRVYVALDFFDASINRIAAYVIGTRATRLAILSALLENSGHVQGLEATGQRAQKLARMEAGKTMPLGAVWDMLCHREGVPAGADWLSEVERYERDVLSARK
jgi:L-rhamnose isomerase